MGTPASGNNGEGDLLDHLLALTSQFNTDPPKTLTATINEPSQSAESFPTTLESSHTNIASTTSLPPSIVDNANVSSSEKPSSSVNEADNSVPQDLQSTPVVSDSVVVAPTQSNEILAETAPAVQNPLDDEHPEWEEDSSPISSDSSDESSDDDAEEGDEAYKLLTLEEQASLLMHGDIGSDDEDGTKGKGSGGQLRTKNEIVEEVIPKPDTTITPEMAITELGSVVSIVENTVVINSAVSGDVRRLDIGSLLCLADRSVIGVISETFGPVPMPFYSVRFTNLAEITEAGLSLGTNIFYSEEHSKYVFPGDLRKIKGTDASNLHDEEPGEGEMEFSDDEAEKAHKDMLKAKKRGGRTQANGGRGSGYRQPQPQKEEGGLSYDDADDDGPYRPLARPASLAHSSPWTEAPQEVWGSASQNRPSYNPRAEDFRGRGRGDRSRASRGRGGDRGRGRGMYSGYSQPPQNRNGNYSHPPSQGPSQTQDFRNNRPPNEEYSPQRPQMWQQPQQSFPQFGGVNQNNFPMMPQIANGYPGFSAVPGFPNMSFPSPAASGIHINPAFFNQPTRADSPGQNQQNQQNSQNQGHQPNSQWS